jgi:hypothetical protein
MATSEQNVLPKVTVDFYSASNKATPVKDDKPAESNRLPTQANNSNNNSVSKRIDSPTPSIQNLDSDSDQDQDTTLGDVLRKCAVPHVEGGGKCFWPSRLLEDVLTVQRIRAELDEYVDPYPKFYRQNTNTQLAERIKERYIVIFALLCLLSKGFCIQQFIAEQVKDSHLPFSIDRRDSCKLSPANTNQPIRSFQKSPLKAVKWQPHEREYIVNYQDSFNPVVFGWDQTGRAQHRDFDTEVILPFVRSQNSSATQQGGFATVDQVEVHPYCHSFHNILPSVSRTRIHEQALADSWVRSEPKISSP